MSPLNLVFAAIVTLILGGISLFSFAVAHEFLNRTRTAFVSATPIADVDDGLVKVHGTVVADGTLDPAVSDTETVMSMITLSRREGLAAKAMGSWEERKRLLRAVPFQVADDSGVVTVEHEGDPHRSDYGGLTRDATVQLDGGEAVPVGVDAAFTGPDADVGGLLEALEEDGDEEAAALAEQLRDVREPAEDHGAPSDVLEDRSPLRAGVPQRFEERFAAPGDEVYVVGTASDGRITNGSTAFQVLHEPRSTFDLSKGAAAGVTAAVVGLAAGLGALDWLTETGDQLVAVVAFIG